MSDDDTDPRDRWGHRHPLAFGALFFFAIPAFVFGALLVWWALTFDISMN